jgi:membrane protein
MTSQSQSQPKRTLAQRAAEARARAALIREQAETRLEQERQRRPSVQWAFEVRIGDRRFAGTLLAGGVAFRLFLWLLPFCLVVVTALGFAASWSSKTPQALAQDAGLSRALAGSVARGVSGSDRGRLLLLLIGLWLLIFAGRGVVKALRAVSILGWRVRGRVQAGIKASLLFSGVILGILALELLIRPLYAGGLVTDLLAVVASTLLVAAVACWGFWMLPRPEDIPWPRMIPGAVLFGFGVEVLRLVTAVYFVRKLASVSDLYGAMGFAAVFLAWLYLLGRLIVVSVLVNATRWRTSEAAAASDSP